MINTVLMNFGERTAYAGRMLLIGMGTIFLSLAILWGVMELFRRLVVTPSDSTASKPAAPKPVAPTPAPVARVESVATAAAPNNDALIAAITAAVAATLAEENGGVVPGFRVVSFKKVTTVSKRK